MTVQNFTRKSLAGIVVLYTFISIANSVLRIHTDIVSLVYFLFPHKLLHSLLFSL